MKTKQQIVDETVTYYSEDPMDRRGLINGSCAYITPNGEMCTVGRCLINPETLAGNLTVLQLLSGSADGLDHLMKPEYRGHAPEFWRHLQIFHDVDDNWDSEGLTMRGRWVVDKLAEDFFPQVVA